MALTNSQSLWGSELSIKSPYDTLSTEVSSSGLYYSDGNYTDCFMSQVDDIGEYDITIRLYNDICTLSNPTRVAKEIKKHVTINTNNESQFLVFTLQESYTTNSSGHRIYDFNLSYSGGSGANNKQAFLDAFKMTYHVNKNEKSENIERTRKVKNRCLEYSSTLNSSYSSNQTTYKRPLDADTLLDNLKHYITNDLSLLFPRGKFNPVSIFKHFEVFIDEEYDDDYAYDLVDGAIDKCLDRLTSSYTDVYELSKTFNYKIYIKYY